MDVFILPTGFMSDDQEDPWDQTPRAQEEFEQTEPPVETTKAYRREARYYLLHRSETAVDRLRYRAYDVDVNLRQGGDPCSASFRSATGVSHLCRELVRSRVRACVMFWIDLSDKPVETCGLRFADPGAFVSKDEGGLS